MGSATGEMAGGCSGAASGPGCGGLAGREGAARVGDPSWRGGAALAVREGVPGGGEPSWLEGGGALVGRGGELRYWEGRRPGRRGSGRARCGCSVQNECGVNWSFQQELEP